MADCTDMADGVFIPGAVAGGGCLARRVSEAERAAAPIIDAVELTGDLVYLVYVQWFEGSIRGHGAASVGGCLTDHGFHYG